MKNLESLNEKELKQTNGGWILPLVIIYVIVEAALNPTAHISAFKEGMTLAEKK
jgi:lactobin A/cerein 7B family class IIb bacteriocin